MNPNWLILDLTTAIYIGACFGVFWVVWMHVLTTPSGLLRAVPKHYPNRGFLAEVLRCEMCASGWSSMILMLIYRFSVVSWGFSIGFDNYTTAIVFVLLQSVLSLLLMAISGTAGIFFAILINKIINS